MHWKKRFLTAVGFLSLLWTAAYAQITPVGDSYTNTADETTNYGAATLLYVKGATETTYIQFSLASIPAAASISQATLKLYVNSVTTAGTFNVDYVNGTWAESTIDASNAPAPGGTIVSDVNITAADKNQYILIDVTSAVQAWLSGGETNNGIALVANGTFNATFDSKENTGTSHPPELDIVAAGNTFIGNETVDGNLSATGVVTGTGFQIGSNLFDYGSYANGNAFLGFGGNMTTTALGITAVGYQALLDNSTGGDNTAIGSLALQSNTSGCCNTASGALALQFNTSGGNNTASGTSALQSNTSGAYNTANGSGALNSNGTGSYNTAGGYQALFKNTTATQNTASGYQALYSNTTSSQNTATGFQALYSNVTGIGGNTANGWGALYWNTTGTNNSAQGSVSLLNNTTGSFNTASGASAGTVVDASKLTGSNDTFLGSFSAVSTGTLSNVTAIGALAEVAESNALVLGSISGVNNAAASTNVGIGTTTPQAALDVAGNNIQILLGNPGCGSGLAGIGFVVEGGFNSCTNFAVVGKNTGDLYINSVESGSTHFRNNNGSDLMTISPNGDVSIPGSLSKGSGSFKIDDPLDPANKYLYHSFVESPDMMNVYNGNIVTDKRGVATVTLPDYFEALNRDFRYQLTVIGQFAQAIVAKEITGNRFSIKTSKPGVKVSWQVTGIRHDAYANAHRIQVEVDKPPQEQGHYLHPELFGAPEQQVAGYPFPSPLTAAGPFAAAAAPANQ